MSINIIQILILLKNIIKYFLKIKPLFIKVLRAKISLKNIQYLKKNLGKSFRQLNIQYLKNIIEKNLEITKNVIGHQKNFHW